MGFVFRKCERQHASPVTKAKGKKDATLKQLRSFLDAHEPQAVRWLVRTWNSQQAAVTYKELREAVLSGNMTEKQQQQWQKDYSTLINTKLAPQWMAAMAAAAEEHQKQFSYFLYDPSVGAAQAYIQEHGAKLVTNLVNEQRDAIQAMVAQASYYDGMTPDRLSQIIRPVIGLTTPQAKANLNYYNGVRNGLLETHPRITKESAEKKAQDAAARYAARQHRYRAMNIARTELATAYNQGGYGAILDAQEKGYIGDCKKVWLTADDERVCSSCGGVDGESVNMNDTFSNGVKLPPAHPQCRCAIAYEETTENLNPTMVSGIINPQDTTDMPLPQAEKPVMLESEPEKPVQYDRYSSRSDVPKEYDEKLFSLAQREQDALTYYTGSNYVKINATLRHGEAATFATKKAIQDIDRAFTLEATDLPGNATLFRGARQSTLDGWENIINKPLDTWSGATLRDKGFISTSIVEKSNFDGEILLTIKAPQGTKGVFVAPISEYKSENEVLLNRGTTFRINNARRDASGVYHLDVTVVN